MIGNVFGKLTVVSYEKKNRQIYWNCKCECGASVSRSTGQLNLGKKLNRSQSCRKCAQRLNKSKDLGESSWKMLFNNYIGGAKRRDLVFDLTFDFFKNFCSMDCHYCGAKPSKHNRYVRKSGRLDSKISEFTASRSWIEWNGIDRKDNSQGYTEGNILPCCSTCNNMKGTLDYQDFISRCGVIYLTRKIENESK